ncbi:ATP/GTP-binding protein [Pseudoclavibacter sp. CFCC 13611]|uniref:ATP/GTP-binding protein n=1 Tax=Pseudoclavibacter sp. CFCC 13611 TaxID=2615178 RepID=UPI001CE4AEF8|nr:ATP/GTP-binding protein [Pseudoclavibacter sp. CFCC 13611]
MEQQIAVFGESGSGKTVLLSSFYGAAQEPGFLESNPFRVLPEDAGQGSRLHANYLGMKKSAKLPMTDHFSGSTYSFSITPAAGKGQNKDRRQLEGLRLVWYDYPGEWLEQEASGPEEAARRIETFRSLLGSDVAFLLVDGQRLLDNTHEEERYLKHLFTSFRNTLISLQDDLLIDGKKLDTFPRIWIIALSKADLLPEMDVFGFRDLVIEAAFGEVNALRKTIDDLVEGTAALAMGEDFVRLSSAKFEPNVIAVDQRIGVDLILPMASVLSFERYARWLRAKLIPNKIAAEVARGVGAFAAALVGPSAGKFLGKLPRRFTAILKLVSPELIRDAVQLAGDRLDTANDVARAKADQLSETLTQFKIDLEIAETDRVLLRSPR